MGGDQFNSAKRLRAAMILGGLLAIAGILGLSGKFVTSPPQPGASSPEKPAPQAEPPSLEQRAAQETARLEAEQAEAGRKAAETQRREAETTWTSAQAAGVAGLEDYLRRYPNSPHVAEARSALDEARQAAAKAAAETKETAAAEQAWLAAQAGGAAALKAYLDRYPKGPRAAEAQAALDGLTRQAERPSPPPTTVASKPADDEAEAPIKRDAQSSEKRRRYYYSPKSYRGALGKPQSSGDDEEENDLPAPPARSRGAQPAARTPSQDEIQRQLQLPRATTRGLTAGAVTNEPKPPPPQAAAPAGETAAPAMPLFPKNPPRASARYEIPDAAFANMKTYGEATKFILGALESGGYVERSYFSTEAGGVAMVTRLERINDDGTPAPAAARWALKQPPDGAISEAMSFLRGLFFVERGHYRTIVFMLQDQPFTQGDKPANEKEARDWISRGANLISPDVGRKPFAGSHCTALIYEFASDGSAVRLVESRLTGKDHLAKSGLLTALEAAR